MAARYWVGGTGTWTTTTTNWRTISGGTTAASAPTSADDVYIDNNSGTGTITLTGTLNCASLNISATQDITIASTGTLSVYGVVTVPNNITWTATSALVQRGTAGLFTFIPISPPITFQVAGYTTTLGASITTRLATATIILISGTLNLDIYNISCGNFASNYTNVRELIIGDNTIYLTTTTTASSNISIPDTTNFTCSGNGGFSAIMSVSRIFTIGTTGGAIGKTANLTLTSGTALASFSTGSWFKKIDILAPITGTVPTTSINVIDGILLGGTAVYTGMTINLCGTSSINTGGRAIGPLYINCAGYTCTTTGAITCTNFNVVGGIFDLQYFNLICTSWNMTGGILINEGQINRSGTLTINIGNGNTYNQNGTIVSGSSGLSMISGTMILNGSLPITGSTSFTGGTLVVNGTCSLGQLSMNAGTLTLNVSISVDRFSRTGSLATTIDFNNNYINITTVTSAVAWIISNDTAAGTVITGNGGFQVTLTSATLALKTTSWAATSGGSITGWPNITFIGSYTPTLVTGSWFKTLDFSAITNFNVAIGASATKMVTYVRSIYLPVLAADDTKLLNWNPIYKDTGNISTQNFTIGQSEVNHTGTTTLQSNYRVGSSSSSNNVDQFLLTIGNIDLNGYILTCGLFSSSNSNVRSIMANNGHVVTETWNNAGANVYIGNAANFTTDVIFHITTTLHSTRYFHSGNLGGVNTAIYKPGIKVLSGGSSGLFFLTPSYFASVDLSEWQGAQDIKNSTTVGAYATTIYTGNLTLSSINNNSNAYNNVTFMAVYEGTITSNSKTLPSLTINNTSGNGTYIADTLNITGTLNIAAGNIAVWAPFNINTINLTGGTIFPNYTGTSYITNNLTINGGNLDWLEGDISVGGTTYFQQGTIAWEVQPSPVSKLITGAFVSTSSNSRTISGGGKITVNGGGAAWNISSPTNWTTILGNYTPDGYFTLDMTSSIDKTFAGGGASYGTINQGGGGNLTITGNNSFKNITTTYKPSTISFTAGSTQTVLDFNANGAAGSLVTLNSTTSGSIFTLNRSSGSTNVNYLNIQDSTATGGATWIANATSINLGNNIGWTFGTTIINSQFMAFFG